MEEGYGVNRRLVMHNDFIILGPAEDPAKIKGTKSAAEAFKKIASSGSLFRLPRRQLRHPCQGKGMCGRSQGSNTRARSGTSRPASAWVRP